MTSSDCQHPGVQRQLATGRYPYGYLCGSCHDTVYPDPNWRVKEAAAQQVVKSRLPPETLRGKYLGGFSFADFKTLENGRVKLVFDGDG
jgi:hypothetical protein